jgi:glucokinase
MERMKDVRQRPGAGFSVGVDLGGTNLRVAAFEGLGSDSWRTLNVHREEVGKTRSPDHLVERVGKIVESLAGFRERNSPDESDAEGDGAEGGVTGTGGTPLPVGIGVAGMPRGSDGFIVSAPQLGWSDVPFGEMLRRRLGPGHVVRIVNDVNAVTFGELHHGAGSGVQDLLAVYVGSGVGGGLIAGGRLVEGASGCAGEIGHMKVVLDDDARRCGCGATGCVEAYAGGVHLDRRVREELSRGAESLAVELAGSPEAVTLTHIDEAASRGDDYALSLWSEVAELLGVTLANAVTLLNPARVVLGGGVLSRTPFLYQRTVGELERRAPPATLQPLEVRAARLGGDAGMVGAALLAQLDASGLAPGGQMQPGQGSVLPFRFAPGR